MPRRLPDGARETLARNLIAVRERLEWSQKEAARRAGLTQNRVSLWETGTEAPGAEGLLRLAVAYGCSVDDFLGGVDEGYDAIIERRIPLDVQRHYQARIDTFISRTTAAMHLALEPGAPAPTTTTPTAAPPKARDKSAPTRARRTPPK